jgi:3-deoxy-D-manno-octulosonic-acid transferase
MNRLRFFSWIYNGCLTIFGCVILPKILYDKFRSGKYAGLIEKKSGKAFKQITKESTPLVWIHAVSMGETKAVGKFAELLKAKYPSIRLLITSTTDTGHAEAKRSLPFAEYHLFLPFDFSWIIRPIVKKVKPDLVILSETDHWFNFLQASKDAGAKIAVINGKLSERSLNRYRLLGPFLKTFFSPIDLFCVQNKLYQDRISHLGIDSKKIAVTGNLKFDAPPEKMSLKELNDFKTKLHIQPNDFVIVAGSTHEEEEVLILNAIKQLAPKFPHIKVLFVPRHPERFAKVEQLLNNSGLGCCKYSTAHESNSDDKTILIDTMGQLKKCFQLANVAIVAGSFVSHVGGHNILEPCFYGVPVIFGPFMHTQAELERLILDSKAGIQTTRETLVPILEDLMQSEEKLLTYSHAGKALTDALQGTSAKTLSVLEKKLHLSKSFRL